MEKANHAQTKLHNSQLVLNLIYEKGPISRAEIVILTSLTPPTVSRLVAELMESELVKEIGYGPSTGGKRPILLQVNDDARHLIGLDLGAGSFRGAIINLRGKVCYRASFPLQDRTGKDALELVFELVDDLLSKATRPLLGIGIGAPGLVDSSHGVVLWAVNVDWQDVPLAEILSLRYQLPIYVSNDCQVAALGEITFGSYAGTKDMIVLNVGYGVGAGIIINNQLMHGDPCGAGEIGHVKVIEDGEVCSCGNTGCLETITSRRAIERRVNVLGLSDKPLNFQQICELYRIGNPQVCKIIDEVGKHLGMAVSNLIGVFGPCRILIAGRVSLLGESLFERIHDEVNQRYKLPYACELEIKEASLGTDIVLLGASALVLPHELANLRN